MSSAEAVSTDLSKSISNAKEVLDQHTFDTIQWHFHDSTGSPFWLGKKKELKFDPLTEIKTFEDLRKFPIFEDDWLRGGPVNRWIPKGLAGKPTFVFETGGTTGVPKSRVVIDDFRIDYELFSHTLPDQYFPKGSNWLMLGPSGPRRLRLAVEHLSQYRGGISFLHRLGPPLGRQAYQEGMDGTLGSVQEALYRSGDYDSYRRSRYQVYVHNSEIT